VTEFFIKVDLIILKVILSPVFIIRARGINILNIL